MIIIMIMIIMIVDNILWYVRKMVAIIIIIYRYDIHVW